MTIEIGDLLSDTLLSLPLLWFTGKLGYKMLLKVMNDG